MRTALVLAIALSKTCSVSGQPAGLPTIRDVAWIAGAWVGSMGSTQFEEHWTEPKGGAMLAVSRTIAREKMVMFEFLRIEERANGVFYVAQPKGRPGVDFKLTKWSEREAVFENPQHDHPKIISYRREGESGLVAAVEGDEKGKHVKQEYRFQRKR